MDFFNVVDDIVYEKGLDKDKVLEVVKNAVLEVYADSFLGRDFIVELDPDNGRMSISEKKIVKQVALEDNEISLKRAKYMNESLCEDDLVTLPFDEKLSRSAMLAVKNKIFLGVKSLEQEQTWSSYSSRVGQMVTGTIHKKERTGYSVNLGDTIAFLPNSCAGRDHNFTSGQRIRAVIKDVKPTSTRDAQVVIDKAGENYVQRLIETEIPEVLEGNVEIAKIARVCGYKTKIALVSKSKNIDPVGACVGLGGSRIKPILNELGGEKIDLIKYSEDKSKFVEDALKPAEIKKVVFENADLTLDDFSEESDNCDEQNDQGKDRKKDVVRVYLNDDQRSLAIGKSGYNIILASKLTGYNIQICDSGSSDSGQSESLPDDDMGDFFSYEK